MLNFHQFEKGVLELQWLIQKSKRIIFEDRKDELNKIKEAPDLPEDKYSNMNRDHKSLLKELLDKKYYASRNQADLNQLKVILKKLNKNKLEVYLDSGSTILIDAVTYGSKNVVELLIEEGVNVNFCDKNGYTALHISVALKKYEVARALIKGGADLSIKNDKSETALDISNEKGYSGISTMLSKYMEIEDLHSAVRANDVPKVKRFLIASKVINKLDSSGKSLLYYACMNENKKIIELLIKFGAKGDIYKYKNGGLLLKLVVEKKEKAIETILKYVTYKSKDLNAALIKSIVLGASLELQKSIIVAGADVHEVSGLNSSSALDLIFQFGNKNLISYYKKFKQLPIWVVCRMGDLEKVKKMLLGNKKLLNKKFSKMKLTLLGITLNNKDHEMLNFLVGQGVDLNVKVKRSFNESLPPLIFASKRDDLRSVKILLKNKMDVNIRDELNRTSLYYFIINNNVNGVKFLLENEINAKVMPKNIKSWGKITKNSEILKLLRNL